MSVENQTASRSTADDASLESHVRTACQELCRRIQSPAGGTAEELLAEYPQIAAHSESALELIYTEFLERQDLGQETNPHDWIARFPQWRRDLEELFQVHQHVSESAVSISKGSSRRAGGMPPELSVAAFRGQAALGEYELLEEIGRGGMGVVHRARHRKLDRIVALKLIRFGGVATPDELTRFRREAESTARLQHPHIVQIFDSGELNGCPYLSMEYIDGGNLTERLARAPMSPREAASLVEALATAVTYAHEQGVIHRDLKPQNVLLTASGVPKLTDFGLAKQQLGNSLSLTRTGAIVGTPCYMAPEQAQSNLGQIGPLTDVYSLGAIFYEALTGRPPFKAASVLETLEQVRSQEPSSITRIQPRVPRDLATICHKCLQKEPWRRYSSAAALSEDLRRYLNGLPIHARRSSALEKLLKWSRRRPITAAISALLLAVTAAWMISATFLWLRADQRRAEAESLWHKAVSARQAEAAQHERAEANLYARQVGLAHQEWQSNHVARADQLLEQCDAARRGWEWDYLKRICHLDVTTLTGLTQQGRRVEYSRDGRLIASCAGEWGTTNPGEVVVWEAATGQQVYRWNLSSGPVFQVRFSSDSRRLMACTVAFGNRPRGETIIWELSDGREVLTIPSGNSFAAAFSPDDRRIATAGADGMVRIWDAQTGAEIRTIAAHKDNVFDVSYSPDGRLLASASRDTTARLWDAETGEVVGTPMLGPVDIRCLAFSPDGKRLATGSYNSMIRVWSVNSCQELLTYRGHKTAVMSLAFSPDGRFIASGDFDWSFRLWRSENGTDVQVLRGHSAPVGGIAYRADGLRIATSAADGTVRTWDPAGRQESHIVIGNGHKIMSLSQPRDADQPLVAVGVRPPINPADLVVWTLTKGRLTFKSLQGHLSGIRHAAVSSDGRIALSAADESIRAWDLDSRQTTFELKTSKSPSAIAISPDGAMAAVGEDSQVRILDLTDGREIAVLSGMIQFPRAIVFDDHGKRIACLSDEGSLHVWDTANWKLIGQTSRLPTAALGLAISADGSQLAVSYESGVIELWRVFDRGSGVGGLSLQSELKGHARSVTGLAFSPDGRRLASISSDRTLRLWDCVSGIEVLSLGQGTNKSLVGFRRDGRQLLSMGEGMQIWDLETSFYADPDLAPYDEAASLKEPIAVTDATGDLLIHEYAAIDCERNRQWFALAFHLDYLIAAQPLDTSFRLRRAYALAEMSRFDKAANDYAEAHRLGRDVAQQEARARLAAGDENFYRAHCDRLVATHADTQDWQLANGIAWCCVLLPDNIAQADAVIRLAEFAAANASPARRASCLNTLGAVLYRAGRYRDAIACLEESISVSSNRIGNVEDWLFLTMAHARLGEIDDAKQWWNKTEAWWSNQMQPMHELAPLPLNWQARQSNMLFHDEALTALDSLAQAM